MSKPKICIVTSVHQSLDSRIFYKQAISMAASGFEVVLIGQHDHEEMIDGVRLLPLSRPRTRWSRLARVPALFKKTYEQKADIYHFHDPELLILGPWLKLMSPAKLIFDAHENVREQISDKAWIFPPLRRFLKSFYGVLEPLLLRFFDGVIIAEDSYLPNYRKYQNVICIHNYPLITDGPLPEKTGRLSQLVYVGGISRERGILELISAVQLLKLTHDVNLALAGPAFSQEFQRTLNAKISEAHLEDSVEQHGQILFSAAQQLVRSAGVGLACLHPVPNYIGSPATKVFEYMAAGLPVIASNFPLWEKVVLESHCGLAVDPLKPKEIAEAAAWLIDHPEQAQEMGSNGRRAVLREYNWTLEKEKLVSFCDSLLAPAKRDALTKKRGQLDAHN